MMKNSKIIFTAVAVNAILILFFVQASYALAVAFNTSDLLRVYWNIGGFSDIVHAGILVNGNYMVIEGHTGFIDFPFWLFFLSTAVNLLFVMILLRRKETENTAE